MGKTGLDEPPSGERAVVMNHAQNDFKRRINASWTLAEMVSDNECARKAAIFHFLEVSSELWRTGCQCNECRDAYLKAIRSLVGE